MVRPARPRSTLLVKGLLLAACSGQIEDGPKGPRGTSGTSGTTMPGLPGAPPGTGAGGTPAPVGPIRRAVDCRRPLQIGRAPLRRLTRVEYNNTVRDLLGDTAQPANAFPPDARGAGFDTDALGNDVTTSLLRQMMIAAEEVAARAGKAAARLAGCRAGEAEADCGARFARGFGERAFRRPLEAAEAEAFVAAFERGRGAGGGLAGGVQAVVESALQAPDFLYLVETGGTKTAEPGVLRLTPHQLAARLSYFVLRTTPDEALLAAAREGKLDRPEGIAAEVDRLLALPRGKAGAEDFYAQWLDLDAALSLQKNTTDAPWFTAAVRTAMRAEARAFVDHAVFGAEADGFATLFAAPYSFLNADLAPIYGLATPPPKEHTRVALDPERRAGILTQPSFLAAAARANDSAPVKRGLFVIERLLCETIAPPPSDVDVSLPASPKAKTTRQLFEDHAKDPRCAVCHTLIDPFGFAFEAYDGVGRYREREKELPVDPAGELKLGDVAGRIGGAVELAGRIAGSRQARGCLVQHWFRYAFGRKETAEDTCTIDALEARFEASRGNLRALVVEVATSDAFRHRRTEP